MADNTETETEIPIWGDELKDFIDIGVDGAPNWFEVTNLLSWEFDDDEEAYEPDYINTRKKKKFILDSSASLEYEKDAYKNNELDEWIMAHEDDANVPVRVCRVRTWEENAAKAAKFLLTPKQLDKNSSGEPIKLKGSMTMSDDAWTKGKWQDNTFIPDGAVPKPGEPSGPGSDGDSNEDLQG